MPTRPQRFSARGPRNAHVWTCLLVCLGGLLGVGASGATVHAPEIETALRAALRGTNIPDTTIGNALQSALWNPDRTAVAVAVPRPAATLLFAFIRRPEGRFLTVDISAVESGNFGKLGRTRQEYRRFETVPTRWLPRDDGYLQVVVRTRAWLGRQRYAVSEPLVIRPNGTPVWR